MASIGLASVSAGCKNPPVVPAAITIRVADEAKNAVEGADIAAESAVVARTSADGVAEIAVTGREGASFALEIRCPAGFRSIEGSVLVRRLDNGGGQPPEYLAHCHHRRHTLIVNIQASGAANLPVRHLGKEIARTDDAGAGKVVIQGDVQERIDLLLDTSDPSLAKAHPQNPLESFVIPDHDGETSWSTTLTFDKKPKPRPVARKPPIAL